VAKRCNAFIVAAFLAVTSSEALASCLNPNADSRLRTFCVAETLVDRRITLGDAMVLDTMLKREGYANGIGLPNRIPRHMSQAFASPVVDYDTNINGGNPDRPLVLGGLTFIGDETRLRRSGFVVGMAGGVFGRRIYGEGKYLDYVVSTNYTYSPKHRIDKVRGGANLCSRNHVKNHWYIDGCAFASRLVRDLDDETNRSFSLSTTKLFSTSKGAFHGASFGVNQFYADDYKQSQLQLGWSTVRRSGPYTALNLSLGEKLPDQMVTRGTASVTLGTTLFNRSLTANVVFSYADGSRLLGIERSDRTRVVDINYAVTSNLFLNVGYREVVSSINYFSEREPLVSIRFAPFVF
jgi:hypothetical protein